MTPEFQRHFDACHTFVPPSGRLALHISGQLAGWLTAGIVDDLRGFSSVSVLDETVNLLDPQALPGIAFALSSRGRFRHRGELFDVRAVPDGPVLSTIDRGALPAFGIQAVGMHLNGLVRRADGLHLWVARRAANKALDPGKLDHLAAGGVSAGMDAWETLIKESAEEASIPEALASRAVKRAEVSYAMMRPEGLRRDILHCYDLDLPEDFTPVAADGEVESFELWPVERAYEAVRDSDAFKFNVNLVLIDLFQRLGMAV